MTLGQKQELFAFLVPRLIDKAFEMGYQVRLGDAFRDPRVHGEVGEKKGYGHAKSCHKLKLAIDLNLFKDGKYITNDVGHKDLGKWWKQQHEFCTWGGDFQDFNHYSFTHQGMR